MRETVSQEDGKQASVGARARPRPASKVHAPRAQGAVASLLSLQRTHGNRFVQRMLDRAAAGREREQPEAVAGARHLHGGSQGCLQRLSTDEAEPAQVPAVVYEALRSPGQPLDSDVRASMESRLGQDFGHVRVHDGALAGRAARSVNSLAFTVNRDIVFAEGQYQPRTGQGQHLLAHELAHTIQQGSDLDAGVPSRLTLSDDSSLEREADEAARSTADDAHSATAASHAPTGLQRYESGEHVQFGGEAGDKLVVFEMGDIKVSYSEMLAMGDLFEDVEQMRKEAKKEPEKFKLLLKYIRQDRDFYEKKIGKKVEEYQWQEATGGRYLDLAGANIEHFAGRNEARWERDHRRALRLASSGQLEEALQVNAFADHYLTDAFSAGHLMDKVQVMEKATKPLKDWTFRSVYLNTLAQAMLADHRIFQRLKDYDIEGRPMNVISLARVLQGIEQGFPKASTRPKFYSGFAKAAHDWLNREIARSPQERAREVKRLEGSAGTPQTSPGADSEDGVPPLIWVTNERGDSWALSGDTTLSFSPETLRIARAAVSQSRENVREAGATFVAVRQSARLAENILKDRLDGMVKRVKDYLPRPTKETKANIEAVEATIANPRNLPASIKGLVEVSVDNLDTLVKELEDNGVITRKAAAAAAR